MIVQKKTVSISSTPASVEFVVNHNPMSGKAYIYVSATTAPNAKTITARLAPDATYVAATNDGSAVSPTAGSDTYTEVDIATEYKVTLATSGATGTATVIVAN